MVTKRTFQLLAAGSAFVVWLQTCATSLHERSGLTAEHLLGQFWLENVRRTAFPVRGLETEVAGPILVELFQDGRVSAIGESVSISDGYISQSIVEKPQVAGGLRLFAQRSTAIVDASGNVPLGVLHRGAYVSVTGRGDQPLTPIGLFPFGATAIGYVERAALEPQPQFPLPLARSALTHAKLGYPVPDGRAPLLFCHDVWVDYRDGKPIARQTVDGIELVTVVDDGNTELARQPTWHEVLEACPAHSIVQRNGKALLLSPQGHPWRTPVVSIVDEVPDDYALVSSGSGAAVRNVIAGERAIWWLRLTETGAVCDEWKFVGVKAFVKDARPALSAKLVHIGKSWLDSSGRMEHYQAVFIGPHAGRAGHILLEPLKFGEEAANKCDCRYDYAILDESAHVLTVMGRKAPDDVIAYDGSEAERWFLDRSSCSLAQLEIDATLALDGTAATRLGFHAYEGR